MSGARTPQQALDDAWAAHEHAERTATDIDVRILLSARRRAAERYPGCARAILSPNETNNWDRGRIIRELVDYTPR